MLHHLDRAGPTTWPCWRISARASTCARSGTANPFIMALDPLAEFHAEAVKLFDRLLAAIEERSAETFKRPRSPRTARPRRGRAEAAHRHLDLPRQGQPVRHRRRRGAAPPDQEAQASAARGGRAGGRDRGRCRRLAAESRTPRSDHESSRLRGGPVNRVVTGFDDAGKPVIKHQGEPPTVIHAGRYTTTELWVCQRPDAAGRVRF